MSKKSVQGTADIPEDLWIEILIRVPINSVVKFRLLSKFHRDLIDSPNFIVKQSDLSHKTSSSSYYIVSSSGTDYLLNKSDINNSSDHAIVHHRLILPPGYDDYLCEGCCKGFLLLRSLEFIMLWNPLTGGSRSFSVDHMGTYTAYYLGHDQVTDDLKVLKVILYTPKSGIDCEIYSSKSDSWRKIIKTNHQLQVKYICPYSQGVFVESTNSVHLHGRKLEKNDAMIVAFDFSTEKFNSIYNVPPDVNLARGKVCLSSLDGFVCVYSYSEYPRDGVFSVWMKKESWAHILSLQVSTLNISCLLPLDFANDGRERLLLSDRGIHLYDLEEKQFKNEVSFVESSSSGDTDQTFVYTPSLRRV